MPACADVRLLVAQTSGCIALFGSEVTEHCGAVAVHGGRVANLTDFVASLDAAARRFVASSREPVVRVWISGSEPLARLASAAFWSRSELC
jgi:hypothetical protein